MVKKMALAGLAACAACAIALAGCADQAGGPSGSSEGQGLQAESILEVSGGELTDDQRSRLEAELPDRLGDGRFSVEVLAPAGDWARFKVRKLPAGKAYDAYLGERLMLYEATSETSSSSAPSQLESASASPAEQTVSASNLEAQGQSALNSSETAFDTRRAWPLSMHAKVDPLIGAEVASGLLQDVNVYLAGHGAVVDAETDLMVSEDGISRAGGTVSFRVMAMAGNDRIVLDMSYDEGTMRHSIERLP